MAENLHDWAPTVSGWQHPYVHNERYALLVGYDTGSWLFMPVTLSQNGVSKMQDILTALGYIDDDCGFGFFPRRERIATLYYNAGNGATYFADYVDYKSKNFIWVYLFKWVRRINCIEHVSLNKRKMCRKKNV